MNKETKIPIEQDKIAPPTEAEIKQITAMSRAISILETASNLASLLNIDVSLIYKWAKHKKEIPLTYAKMIESITAGKVQLLSFYTVDRLEELTAKSDYLKSIHIIDKKYKQKLNDLNKERIKAKELVARVFNMEYTNHSISESQRLERETKIPELNQLSIEELKNVAETKQAERKQVKQYISNNFENVFETIDIDLLDSNIKEISKTNQIVEIDKLRKNSELSKSIARPENKEIQELLSLAFKFQIPVNVYVSLEKPENVITPRQH